MVLRSGVLPRFNPHLFTQSATCKIRLQNVFLYWLIKIKIKSFFFSLVFVCFVSSKYTSAKSVTFRFIFIFRDGAARIVYYFPSFPHKCNFQLISVRSLNWFDFLPFSSCFRCCVVTCDLKPLNFSLNLIENINNTHQNMHTAHPFAHALQRCSFTLAQKLLLFR